RYIGPQFTNSIGHTALLDILVKLRLLGLSCDDYVILFDPRTVGNLSYLDCWRPYFSIIEDPEGRQAHSRSVRLAELMPAVLRCDDRYQWLHDVAKSVEERWQAQGREPLLKLTDECKGGAQHAFADLGLPPDAWFVTVHVRHDQFGTARNASIA